jgi:hypothetical protein
MDYRVKMTKNYWGFLPLIFSGVLQVFIGYVIFKLSVEYEGDLRDFFRALLLIYIIWEAFHIGYNLILFYAATW